MIAVKDWLSPSFITSNGGKAKPQGSGHYQVLRRNLLKPRAQPIYGNEFHLKPDEERSTIDEKAPTVSKEAGVDEISVAALDESESSASGVKTEPVYAVVNKGNKGKYKSPIASGPKYSFLTDTLARKNNNKLDNVGSKLVGECKIRVISGDF